MSISSPLRFALLGASCLALTANPSPGQENQEAMKAERPTLYVYSDYV